MSRLTGPAAREFLTRAVSGIEARSSAEVVLAIRRQSGTYLHADLVAGGIAAFATLAFLLFSPWDFEHWSFLVDPFVVGVIAGLLCSRAPWLRRILSPRKLRQAAIQLGARATFHDKSVGFTRRATGVLVYISLLERAVVIMPDKAIVAAVPAADWQRTVHTLEAAVKSAREPRDLGNALEVLGNALALGVPRTDDDENELPDEVDIG